MKHGIWLWSVRVCTFYSTAVRASALVANWLYQACAVLEIITATLYSSRNSALPSLRPSAVRSLPSHVLVIICCPGDLLTPQAQA
jgi:hypothetical protein